MQRKTRYIKFFTFITTFNPFNKKLKAFNDLNPLNILFNFASFIIFELLTYRADLRMAKELYKMVEHIARIIIAKSNLKNG